MSRSVAAALFDVDGTLVDSNYLHAVTWWEAFIQAGYQVPMADIHRVIGMGSDQMLDALLPAGRDTDGDARLSSAHSALYGTYWTRLRPLPSAAFPQAGLARLGHGDDAADPPAGDPAALAQAFVVLTAIIGLLPAGYAASLRRAVRRPEYDIGVRLPAEDRNSVSRKGNMPVSSEN